MHPTPFRSGWLGASLALALVAVPLLAGAAWADDRGHGRFDSRGVYDTNGSHGSVHANGSRGSREPNGSHGAHTFSDDHRSHAVPETRRETRRETRQDTRQDTRHDADGDRHHREARDRDRRPQVYLHVERHDRDNFRHDDRDHHAFYPRGHRFDRVPGPYVRVWAGSHLYFYWEGVFFRPYGLGYVVVGAPLGARVHHLPVGYVTFVLGPRRYFYVDATYYLWDDFYGDYVVVDEPDGADKALAAADVGSEMAGLIAYPAEGQSAEQQARDRDACHAWAVAETGFDPLRGDTDATGRAAYRRAMTACLEGRGYTVE